MHLLKPVHKCGTFDSDNLRHNYLKYGREPPVQTDEELHVECLNDMDWHSVDRAILLLHCLIKGSEKVNGQFTEEECVIEYNKDHKLIDDCLENEIK